MIFENIFCNFLAYEDIIIDNDDIEKFCYQKMAEDEKGRVLSNRGGWQSNDLFLPVPELCELTSVITYNMRKLAKQINLKDIHNLYLNNFWININKNSNSNIPHTHPNSILTAVYYVKVPEFSGTLKLFTPINNYDEYFKDFMIEKYNEYNSTTYNFIPKKGKLVFFPSWLMHEVEPNKTDSDRISIAFNSMYR
jgi:uncharacterized protein (TIGR02466 family)